MRRMGMVIGVKPEATAEYKRLHATGSAEVNALLSACGVRNYSIYLREPENLLFGTSEYHGTDFEADMAKMAADPKNQEWWAFTIPCQKPLERRNEGEWWAMMEEVFHHD